jgi:hypothetical protein
MDGAEPDQLIRLSRVLDMLSEYAEERAAVNQLRGDGKVRQANKEDAYVSKLYKQLPAWARWKK